MTQRGDKGHVCHHWGTSDTAKIISTVPIMNVKGRGDSGYPVKEDNVPVKGKVIASGYPVK